LPSKTGGKARVCGKVGSENPMFVSAFLTGLERRSKTELEFFICILTITRVTDALTFRFWKDFSKKSFD